MPYFDIVNSMDEESFEVLGKYVISNKRLKFLCIKGKSMYFNDFLR